MFRKKMRTVFSQPTLAIEYVSWIVKNKLSGGNATRQLRGGIRIGGFSNFSEYYMVQHFIDQADLNFLQTYDFGDGELIDIGANLGVVSLILAKRYPNRRVTAFEPNPTTFQSLETNISLNGLKNIRACKVAISDQDGTTLFNADPINRGTASISAGQGTNDATVASQCLDTFATTSGIRKIGLLKIDVEGFETLVFKGGQRVLRNLRPTAVLFEVCPVLTERRGFDPRLPANILVDCGYALHRRDAADGWQKAHPSEIATVTLENWLALPA